MDLKANTITWWKHYPETDLQSLPPDMPLQYRRQFRSLLSFVAPNPAVANLAYVSQDPSGQTSVTPVQNRPWEWTEYLGDASPIEAKPEDKDKGDTASIKNSGSLSLELFAARVTGERVLPHHEDARTEFAITTFQDDLASGNIFQRDWRETRAPHLLHPERVEQEDEVGPLPIFNNGVLGAGDRHAHSHRSSPVSSIPSRGSAGRPASFATHRQSPSGLTRFSGSTAGDPIDVDSIEFSAPTSSRAGSKRKSATVDDEIQIIGRPAPTDNKRLRGKPRQPRRR